MFRRFWPLLVVLSITACGEDDDPVGPGASQLRQSTVESWDYVDNRFFRLDLPVTDVDGDLSTPLRPSDENSRLHPRQGVDVPGRSLDARSESAEKIKKGRNHARVEGD